MSEDDLKMGDLEKGGVETMTQEALEVLNKEAEDYLYRVSMLFFKEYNELVAIFHNPKKSNVDLYAQVDMLAPIIREYQNLLIGLYAINQSGALGSLRHFTDPINMLYIRYGEKLPAWTFFRDSLAPTIDESNEVIANFAELKANIERLERGVGEVSEVLQDVEVGLIQDVAVAGAKGVELARLYQNELRMPVIMSEVCAGVVLENEQWEADIKYLWAVKNGEIVSGENVVEREILGLFEKAYDYSISLEDTVETEKALRDALALIAKFKAADFLSRAFRTLGLTPEQRRPFEKIMKDHKDAELKINGETKEMVLPKWVVEAGLVHEMMTHLRPYYRGLLTEGSPVECLEDPVSANVEHESPKEEEKEPISPLLLAERQLKQKEWVFDHMYNEMLVIQKSMDDRGGNPRYVAYVEMLDHYLGIAVGWYEVALRRMLLLDKKRAMDSYRPRKEIIERLYQQYEVYLPKWSLQLSDPEVEKVAIEKVPRRKFGRGTKMVVVDLDMSLTKIEPEDDLMEVNKARKVLEMGFRGIGAVYRGVEAVVLFCYSFYVLLFVKEPPLSDEFVKPVMEKASRLRLTPAQRNKLKLMMYSLPDAVQAAEDLAPDKHTFGVNYTVTRYLTEMPGEQLEKIADLMEMPTIIVIPRAMSCQQVIDAMDLEANRHYPGQNKVKCELSINDSLLRQGNSKMQICIVDTAPYAEPVAWQCETSTLSEFAEHADSYLTHHGLRRTTPLEYLVASYNMIRKRKAGSDAERVLDSSFPVFLTAGDIQATGFTVLDVPNEDAKKRVVYAYFDRNNKRIVISSNVRSQTTRLPNRPTISSIILRNPGNSTPRKLRMDMYWFMRARAAYSLDDSVVTKK